MNPTRAVTRRWVSRGFTTAAATLVVLLPLVWLGFDPDPVPVALLVSLSLLACWTVLDSLLEPSPPWWVHRVNLVTPVGADQRLGRYAGMLEDHLAAQHPHDAVRLQLSRLASAVLWQQHGMTITDPRAGDLLGDRVVDLLAERERRFTLVELRLVLDAVERVAGSTSREEHDAPAAPAR